MAIIIAWDTRSLFSHWKTSSIFSAIFWLIRYRILLLIFYAIDMDENWNNSVRETVGVGSLTEMLSGPGCESRLLCEKRLGCLFRHETDMQISRHIYVNKVHVWQGLVEQNSTCCISCWQPAWQRRFGSSPASFHTYCNCWVFVVLGWKTSIAFFFSRGKY